nr:hypothetical protein B0A51_09680 [Rachicladosporium sp. CCFEE 5018]
MEHPQMSSKIMDLYEAPREAPPPYVSGRHRLIVGIDYGTTYSGISYVTSDKKHIDDIHVVRSWPGKDGEWKTPTRIAYASENQKIALEENQWGYRAEAPMVMCSWTKLLLDASARPAQSDDHRLQSDIESGKLRLPAHRNAQGVTADYLHELYKHLKQKLTRELGASIVASTPMDVWLTVPAVWSDQAQSATREAALEAGFGKGNGDTISIIPEPEAAAVAVLKTISRPEALNKPAPGETIMIVDCGGGTVDITTYAVEKVEPAPVFEEVCAKCGSTSIDRAFHELMSERFGSAWGQIEERRKGPGSKFMDQWERVKRSFGDTGDERNSELQLIIRDAPESQYYDEEEGMVKLTKADVRQVFEPAVAEVIALVVQQNETIKTAGKKLDRLVLVGGFGESAYLYSRLKKWCQTRGIQAYCPEYPQAAIVRGAALRGLIGIAPRTKRCRRHYGCAIAFPFREGVDPPSDAIKLPLSTIKHCKNRMLWMIKKGDVISEDTTGSHKITYTQEVKATDKTWTMRLYTIDQVGTVTVDMGAIKTSTYKEKRGGMFSRDKFQKIPMEIEVNFGAKSGVLGVRALCDGQVAGAAELTFD